MSNSQKIYFVSGNKNKITEIKALAPAGFDILGLDDLGLSTDIVESGTTIHENSAIKSQFVYDRFQIPCFADDTGLEVEALNGSPGVYSARYAGESKDAEANMNLLLSELKSQTNRRARFLTVITYIDKEGKLYQFEGIVNGSILTEKKGEKGFGYDPVFLPEGKQKSFAEMTLSEKNKISHRGRAFKAFFAFLMSGE